MKNIRHYTLKQTQIHLLLNQITEREFNNPQTTRANVNANIGIKNIATMILKWFGITISLENNLTPSASGYKTTRFGHFLVWV